MGRCSATRRPATAQVLDTRKFVLALRWSALDADNQTVLSGLQSNLAQTVDELMAAFAIYHSPMQNVVAADTQGRTRYQAIGRAPLRQPDNDLRGVAPAPGWDSKYDWTGELAPGENPHVDQMRPSRPRAGMPPPTSASTPAGYPHFLGSDWNTPERFDRIESLLAAKPRHTAASLREVQADIVSTAALKLLPVLLATNSNHALARGGAGPAEGFRRRHAGRPRGAADRRGVGRRADARPDRSPARCGEIRSALRQAPFPPGTGNHPGRCPGRGLLVRAAGLCRAVRSRAGAGAGPHRRAAGQRPGGLALGRGPSGAVHPSALRATWRRWRASSTCA